MRVATWGALAVAESARQASAQAQAQLCGGLGEERAHAVGAVDALDGLAEQAGDATAA